MDTATVQVGSTLSQVTATPRDLAVNGLVLGVAGAAWLGWAQEAPPAGWSVPLGIASVVGVLVAVLAGVLSWRSRHGASAMADECARRTYYRVVGIEVAAIVVGAVVLGNTGQAAYIAAWILFVVGTHFVPLGRLFHIRSLVLAGVLAAAVSVGALLAGLLWTVLPSAVAGGFAGPTMIVFGVWSLLSHRRVAR